MQKFPLKIPLWSGKGSIGRRLPKDFIPRAFAMTKEPEEVTSVLNGISSMEGNIWVPAWSRCAEEWEWKGRTAMKEGKMQSALSAIQKASAYYSLAVYPWLKDDVRRAAYRKVKETFKLACEWAGTPVKSIEINFEGKVLRGYLRRPADSQGHEPLILFIRGLDSTKEIVYWDENRILQNGFAVFSIDFPGMGESDFKMEHDSERIFSAVLDAFSPHGAYGNDNLKVEQSIAWGMGFGGYWAYRLAAFDQRIRGAISIGGPVHLAFSPSLFSAFRRFREIWFITEVSRAALGVESRREVVAFMRGLSLVKQNILRRITTPLLYVNGRRDQAVTIREADIVRYEVPAGSHAHRNVLVYSDAGHLAIEELERDVLPQCLEWIETIPLKERGKHKNGKKGPDQTFG